MLSKRRDGYVYFETGTDRGTMSQTTFGQTNLAPKVDIQGIVPSSHTGFWLAVAADGNYLMCDPSGNLSHNSKDDGAWQVFTKQGNLAIFKYGVFAFSEGMLA